MADWIVIDDDDKQKLNLGGGLNRYNFNFRYGFEGDMENCDLPPPLNVFEGLEKTIVLPPLPSPSPSPPLDSEKEEDGGGGESNLGKEKWEVWEALRLSQSRARKAEKLVEKLSREIDDISKLLVKKSMGCSAYKQWLKVMEFRVAELQNQLKKKNGGSENMGWVLAAAFCLGISAGFGITIFGYGYMLQI